MSPIHKGVVIGRKVREALSLAKKVKKNLVSRKLSTVTLTLIYDDINDYPEKIERLTNYDAEDGTADDFIYEKLVDLIRQLLRTG